MEDLKIVEDRLIQLEAGPDGAFIKALERFRYTLKKPPLSNAGLGTFTKVLAAIDSSYSTFEKNRMILSTRMGEKFGNNEQSQRDDVLSLYTKYLKDFDPGHIDKGSETTEQYEYSRTRAKKALVEMMVLICKKWNFELIGTGEVRQLGDEETIDRYFKVYYWWADDSRNRQQLKTAAMHIVAAKGKDRPYTLKKAIVTTYTTSDSQKRSSVLSSYNIIQHPGLLYFHFQDDEKELIESTFIISAGDTPFTDWNYLTGIFSTAARRNTTFPITGRIVLKRITSEDFKLNNKEEQIPEIFQFLQNQRLFGTNRNYETLEEFPTHQEVAKLKKFEGIYRITYFHRAKHNGLNADSLDTDCIEEGWFQIKVNGEIGMGLPGRIYNGKLNLIFSPSGEIEALMASVQYLPDQQNYRFTIYLRPDFKDNLRGITAGATPYKSLLGVYAGMEHGAKRTPTCGMMVFEKIPEIDDPKNLDFFPIAYDIPTYRQKPNVNTLIKIFEGISEHYFELLPSLARPFQQDLDSVINKFEGNYYLYSLSTLQRRISRIPMRILSGGLTEIKSRAQSNNIQSGMAWHNGNNRMSIYMESPLKETSYSHLLFNTGTKWRDDAHTFFGVSSRFNSKDCPSGRLEILVREDEVDFEKLKYAAFDIDSEDFWIEDRNTGGVLSYIRSNADHSVISRNTPDQDLGSQITSDPTSFYAACYASSNAVTEEQKLEALRFLYGAYVRGYGRTQDEKDLIKKEMELSFKTVISFPRKAAPENSDLPPLTFQAILDEMLKNKEQFSDADQ